MIGDYVDILSGYAFNASKFNEEGLGLPIVRIRDVGKDRAATYFEGEYSEDFILQNGDFLIGMDGDFRLSEWKGGKALLNQRVCKIIPNREKINPRYLLHLLPKELKKIEDTTSFATVKHLSVKKIRQIQIPLPPLETQKKIAAILDAADAYRQKTKVLLAKYEELTQSLFLDMFGDPGENNSKFDLRTINDVALKVTDGDHATPRRSDKGYKLLSCRNVKQGYIDFTTGVDYVEKDEFDRMFKRCNPEKGDILISCSGTIGRTTEIKIDEPFVLVRSAALIKLKRELLNPTYMEYYLRTSYMQAVMQRKSNSSGQANLFTGPIKALPVLIPTMNLQNQFATRVQKIEAQKAQAQLSLEKAEELFNSLLQRAFKGELV